MKHTEGKFRLSALIGCLVAPFCGGIVYLWSVFKASTMGYYGWSDGSVNLIASFMLFGFTTGNLIGGNIQDRTHPRLTSTIGICLLGGGLFLSSLIPPGASVVWFYLTYCALGGLGSGFLLISSVSGLQKWLPHRRGLSTGLSTAAFGLSTVVFTPVIQFMLNRMSMPMALRTLATILFVCGIIACLFIRLPDAAYLRTLPPVSAVSAKSSLAKESLPPLKAMRTLPFWLMLCSLFLYNGTWNMLTPLIKGLGLERGLGETAATMAISLTGITQACGRLLMSTLSDKIGRFWSLVILCAITLCCALSLTGVGGWLYLIAVLMTAFAFGGPAAVFPAFTADLFGPKYSGGNYGCIIMGLGISSVVFNAISNQLYAATGTYTMTFLLGAVTVIITLGLQIGINRYISKRAPNNAQTVKTENA